MLSDNGAVARQIAGLEHDDTRGRLTRPSRVSGEWSGLRAEYSWLPPFEGAALTKPNRIEVVFSPHDDVVMDQEGQAFEVRAVPGAMFVVGPAPTTLRYVGAYSDTLEMYPEQEVMRDAARAHGVRDFEFEPTLRAQRAITFARDPIVLAVAHVLRGACIGRRVLSDLEAGGLAQLLAERLVARQYGASVAVHSPRRLDQTVMARICEYVEAGLTHRITLTELARVATLSPFHFARCFKATTGLAPHQYVAARRIERARHLIMTTSQPVHEVAWSVGFENISHFRRQFASQVGVVPGVLRRAIRGNAAALDR